MSAWGLIVFLIGMSPYGVNKLVMKNGIDGSNFLFPIGGKGSGFYLSMLIIMFICLIICFFLSAQITDRQMKSYTRQFLIATALGYSIGFLNIFPQSKLLGSSLAVIVFATSIFITIIRIHQKKIKSMNDEIKKHQEFLRTTIDMNPSLIYAINKNKEFTLVNKAFAHLYGKVPNELEGHSVEILYDEKEEQKLYEINEMNEHSVPEEITLNKNGNKIWLQSVKIPIKTYNEEIILGVSTDITERKKQEEEMKYLAFHDTLTGLPNRRKFNIDLIEFTQNAKNHNKHLAVFFLDLDRFKYVNDTLSHATGDTLLSLVAYQLETCSEENKDFLVYRIGGDEFTIILPNSRAIEAELFAMKILKKFKEPLTIKGNSLFITPSIGISIFPEDGEDAETLMKNADTAMYFVKEKGKNGYKLFQSDMKETFYRKMMIEKGLRKAIDNEEFKLVYQPQLDLKNNVVIGVEALLRWNSEEFEMIPPSEFIPVAEEVGLINQIGEWVLRTACKQCNEWHMEGRGPIKIAVNISMKQFLEGDFVYNVSRILDETQLNPTYLELEITEKIAMTNHEKVIEIIESLKSLGVRIAIDNFGTGYSSLNYLGKIPIDVLKIDRTLVKNISMNNKNATIVQSIISITKKLQMDVIVVGIETKEELQYIRNMECYIGQGYFISKPKENPFR
ncbi:sensor domain-containing protein [Heyndrickxia vini]|uniref:EAL domain-containing protein n=1 Tax=Heyndrickxia vini TaxID=1476025 RepID=A0ABX7DWE2_9BACI|nr:EAL domain-containing protein [Heyndrickxia vini]QQZ07818.1 EAL domain-containing protein [Heyndrickxia vini]